MQQSDLLVIFGITGDLAKKMTLPSLYRLEKRGLLTTNVATVAFDDWTLDKLIAHAHECVQNVEGSVDEEVFKKFAARLTYIHGDFTDPALYAQLASNIKGSVAPTFYLEIPPNLFVTVAQQLSAAKLLEGDARIVFEKPFGTSLETAIALNNDLHKIMREEQIFRLDHYLGKEPVLDLQYLRFSNTVFEPIWNHRYVDCVMVTMAENFGVEDRGSFYDSVGTLRDVVQNHLLNVISLAAMEPGVADLSSLRQDVFNAIPEADPKKVIRGQYEGYLDIKGVSPDSTTETFIALELQIDNWRWHGVPIFIRAGKNLPVKATEVVLRMKAQKTMKIAGELRDGKSHDDIVLRIGSDDGVSMYINVKKPGEDAVEQVELDVDFKKALGDEPEPYELLLTAAMADNKAYFPNEASVERTWTILQPILENPPAPEPYAKGSWGPQAAVDMTARYGGWREPTV